MEYTSLLKNVLWEGTLLLAQMYIKLHNRNSGSYHQSSYHYADFVHVAVLLLLLPLLRAKLNSCSLNHIVSEVYNPRNSTFCGLFKEATQKDKLQNLFFSCRGYRDVLYNLKTIINVFVFSHTQYIVLFD